MNRVITHVFVTTSLLVSSSQLLAQEEKSELDFFRDAQTGASFNDVPEGTLTPKVLSEQFQAESRFIDWAFESESMLKNEIKKISAGVIKSQRVRCNTTICEIMLVVEGPSERVSNDVGVQIGSVAGLMNKEMTAAIGVLQPGKVAILAYLHDRE